jgi:GxxExxY protein
MSQAEFGALAYEVMRTVFAIRDEFGRFFDEKIYKRELANRFSGVAMEVPVQVAHGTFRKLYLLDVLVNDGALFEFKTVDILNPRHEAQLLNYLLLLEISHGKLVNLRPEAIEQRFVNSSLRLADRLQFDVERCGWDDGVGGAELFSDTLLALLQDWGTGLELALYDEAMVHFFGGETQAVRSVEVQTPDHPVGQQKMRLAAPGVAFKITGLEENLKDFEAHSIRLLEHTNLDAILWANISRRTLTFRGLRQKDKGQKNKSK